MSSDQILLVCPACGSDRIISWERTTLGYCGVRWWRTEGVIEVDYDAVYDDKPGEGSDYADDLSCSACGVMLTQHDLISEGSEPDPDWTAPQRPASLSAEDALDTITALLDGREWRAADDLEAIAETLRRTGRTIGEPR